MLEPLVKVSDVANVRKNVKAVKLRGLCETLVSSLMLRPCGQSSCNQHEDKFELTEKTDMHSLTQITQAKLTESPQQIHQSGHIQAAFDLPICIWLKNRGAAAQIKQRHDAGLVLQRGTCPRQAE